MAKEITKPTQKQIDYAMRIAADLDISLPEKETSDAYSEFISVNKLKPTIKQKEYAAKIAGILNVSMPEEETKTAYKEFVDINKEAFFQRKIELANAVNILDYARSQGLELKRDGRDYRVKDYSGGFIITPEKNSWNWFAENQGGGIVQLCMFLENKTYQEAVDTLVHDDMESIRRAPDWKPEPEQPKEFNLPEKNNTNRHVYAYLTKTRGIDEEIVKDMLDKGYIYENQQKSCVFVGRDNEGIPRHASVRSTNVSGKAYKKDVYGSQKKYSFSISGTSGTLNVFEAPIDLLSYMSLQKLQGKPINDSYLALGGVTDKALERFLEDYKDIKVLRICTDGDDAGKNAASKMDEKFGKDLKVIRQVPEHKDFNEDLIELRQILAEDVEKNSVTTYEEQIKKQNKIVDEKSAETYKQSKQLTEQIKNGDYKNLNERMQDLLDSMEDLTNSVADRTKMRLEEMNRKDWERLLGNAQWIQLERPKELPTEYFEDSKIEKVELLYELEEMHEQEIKSSLAEQINSLDKFYLGYVNGRKELIFRAPFFDSEEYYVSGQATEDYMRGHKSLKELAADIYNQPDLISLAVDEGHLNHEEREKSFVQQVDESLRGDMPFYSSLKVCDTPELLLQVGCEQLPMLYTQKHLRNAVKPVDEQKHQHGLSVDQIKALPQLLESPVMVLDSVSRKDSIVVVTSEFDKEDNPVVVSVKPNGKGRYEIEEINANFITSVYSKNKFVKFFERNIEADSVLYISKEKSQTLFERWGLQLPELANNLDFDRIIHLSNNIVNSKNIIPEENNNHPMMGVNITTDINEDFTREDFTGVKFQGNKITEAVFTECNFTDALITSEIIDSQFIRCTFENAKFENTLIAHSNFKENNFEGTHFQGVSIKESLLRENDFLDAEMDAVFLHNNFIEENRNMDTIRFHAEGLAPEEAEIIRRDYMEKLGLTEEPAGISDDMEKMQQGKIPVAIESTVDYENPEIGFTRFATENMPAGTKYRLVTYGEDGKLIPYQKASVIYNDRAKVQEYVEEHKNELEIVSYDDMVYQAGNRNAEYIRKQNQLIEEGLHNFSFDEEGYLHFSININDSSYEGLYRVYNPEKGRSRMLVSIENGEKEPFFEKNWELIRRNLELYVNEHPMIGAEGEIIPREKVSVYCEWSEHDAFEEDRVYSVSEFDRLMKQADTQWRELRKKEQEQYGDADTAFESLREQGLPQHQGYAKVKYTVYVPGMEPLTLRQDVGDGFGSMIDYIKRTMHKHYEEPLLAAVFQEKELVHESKDEQLGKEMLDSLPAESELFLKDGTVATVHHKQGINNYSFQGFISYDKTGLQLSGGLPSIYFTLDDIERINGKSLNIIQNDTQRIVYLTGQEESIAEHFDRLDIPADTKEWNQLLERADWIKLDYKAEVSVVDYEKSESKNAVLLYELAQTWYEMQYEFTSSYPPVRFNLGLVEGKKELIIEIPFSDPKEYYISEQATKIYMENGLNELTSYIKNWPEKQKEQNRQKVLQSMVITEIDDNGYAHFNIETLEGNILEGEYCVLNLQNESALSLQSFNYDMGSEIGYCIQEKLREEYFGFVSSENADGSIFTAYRTEEEYREFLSEEMDARKGNEKFSYLQMNTSVPDIWEEMLQSQKMENVKGEREIYALAKSISDFYHDFDALTHTNAFYGTTLHNIDDVLNDIQEGSRLEEYISDIGSKLEYFEKITDYSGEDTDFIMEGRNTLENLVNAYKDIINVTDQKFVLTDAKVSLEMQDILKRLEKGEEVSIHEINATKEIQYCRSIADNGKETYLLDGREDKQKQVLQYMESIGSASGYFDENGKMIYDGDIRQDRRLDIVIGFIGAGKSSALTDVISQEFHSKVIDNDMAKAQFVEYQDGLGARLVHEEAQMICDKAFAESLKRGENIVMPKVGSNVNKLLQNTIAKAKVMYGYEVNVHFMDLDREKALGRVLSRLISDGRFLDPELIYKYCPDKEHNYCERSYEALKQNGLVSGYSRWDNDVAKGEKPFMVENYNLTGEYIANARVKENQEGVVENEGSGLQNDGDSRQGVSEDDGEYGRVGESSDGGLHENGKEDLSGGSRSLEEGRGTVDDDLEKTEIIGEIKDDIPQALRKLQDEDRINTEVIDTLEAMEKTEDVLQALNEAYEERKSITKRVIELTWDKDDQEPLADAVLQEASTQEFSAKSYADFAASHQQALKETEVSRIPVVINAFGGPGSGKSVSCMDICQQLKKLGYNAEYVQEYAKELVYDKDWELLDGSPDNQFEVLKEQLRRVDRLYGKADFIVTDSPVLLNGVYNKSLTPEYDAMVTSLYNDFENFTYFVERDASAYQQEGRIQNLEESQKIDQDIKQLLSEKEIYYGTYNHNTIDKIVSNAIRTFNRINQTGEEATKKQIAYAEKIAKTLDIDLPEEKTKAAYKAFISENQEKFAIINAPLREEKTSAGNYQDYLQMVAENGSTFKDVPKEHYTDELFLAAVSNWGNAIRLIPEERITAEIAMASVQQFGLNLKYVPERLKSEDICVAAYVSSSGKSVRYTPGDMKDRVKEQGQIRLKEDNQGNPNAKRQLEEEKLQEQGQEWITQIDNMLKEHESDPEAMIEDIAFASKFYKYSAKNIQLMRRQNKGITYVASASAFEKMGYHIKDNEPAMIGRVPVFARYVTNEQDERIYSWNYTPEIKQKIKEGTFTEEQTVRKFKFAAAFYDISQTDCPADDYPSIFHMGVPSEFHQEAFNAMKEFAEKTLGFRVMVTDLKSISLRGSCEPDNKIIRINERLESTMMLSTLCHEIAHGIIHTSKNSGKMSTAQKECEADVMDIMLESSLGLSINESRREHLFQSFHAYKEEQAAKERPYEVTLEKLIDRVQTKVFRPYAEDMNYYLDIHLPAEGSQNEIIAESVIKNIALLDSVSGTDHREEIGKQKEIFDAGRMEEYQELYQRTKEEYRLNNSFVPKLAILKSMDGETFYVQDIRLLDEKTAAMIKEHPEEITMEHLPYNIEAGNILALKESVLADSRIYVVNKEEQLADVTESLQAAFKIQETRINCSFDVKTEYQCLHNLLENGFGLEQEYIKRYEYLCSAFDFSKNLETDSGIRLMAQINLVTEGLSQNNRELIAEYVFRTGNFAKAQDYAKQIENEPYITRKLLLEMKLVDSYKYMLWTIEQYENSNDISEKNRITTGAYNSSAIPVLSENVNSLAQINNSFLFIRKYASPESVKYYAIVEEDEIFRIAYVELNEYQPETVYSTVSFGSHGEAEEFYELYLKTPKTRLADGNQAENLVKMENKENQIALSDITSIGKTIASEKQQYKEMGIDEEGALELLRTEIRDEYPDIKGVKVTEIDNDLQILKDFKRMVAYYGEEHFIELCNLNDFTDKAAVEESFQLSRWLTEQEEILAGMDYTGSEDVKQCVEAALESSVTGTDIEQAFNAIDSAVLSAEFSNLETEFEGFEEYNNVLDTLKAARVTPDKFCYIDFDAAPGPYLYTSDRAGNIYRKPLRDEWDGSVRDLNVRLKEGGYEICSSLDDFKAYSANNRLGIFDPSSKEKNEAYVRILESTNDMLPKNHILSVYDFKNTVDKLYSGSREFNDDITYKLVTRKDKEIHSYIDTYSGNREQNVYEQLYAKAQEKEQVPELSRVISRQYYQDQVSFNENHQIRPLLEQLKKQDKPIEDSEELNALMGTNDKLKEEIRKLDLSPADAELLKLTAGSIQTEQIANMERQMQMNQQVQQT